MFCRLGQSSFARVKDTLSLPSRWGGEGGFLHPEGFVKVSGVRISEIFYSIQGEGRLIGMPSVFVRTSGCNLRCVWCDTPYTSWHPEGEDWSVEKVLREVGKYPAPHVVITGGEPLIAPDVEKLTSALKDTGRHITIETAATVFKPVTADLMSMSPKLANSSPWNRAGGKFAKAHEEHRLNFEAIAKFLESYDYQLKFVVDGPEDFEEIKSILAGMKGVDPARVLIMAQGKTRSELREKAKWIVELCKKYGYGFTPRLHIELFGNRRGT